MLLEIEGLSAGYGLIQAISDVSLNIAQGEIVVVIGANGGGKSTLLKSVCGLMQPRSGRVLYKGVDITGRSAHDLVKAGISLVPEGRQVFPDQTVRENILLGAYTRLRKGEKREVEADLERYFVLFPILGERREQFAGTLSGGEQQMLALSRGLMSRPDLLMIDELSLGLAPKVVSELFEVLVRLNRQGTTILLVEQLAWLGLGVCHRGYVLEAGRIVLSGDREELLRNPSVLEAYVGKGPA
jgi:branched-chain amino acid transport system ATP-binding protein